MKRTAQDNSVYQLFDLLTGMPLRYNTLHPIYPNISENIELPVEQKISHKNYWILKYLSNNIDTLSIANDYIIYINQFRNMADDTIDYNARIELTTSSMDTAVMDANESYTNITHLFKQVLL